MAKKRDNDHDDPRLENEPGVSRRDFVRTGAAAGLGAGALPAPDPAQAQVPAEDIAWDYEVDVVVAGGQRALSPSCSEETLPGNRRHHPKLQVAV